MAAGTLTLANFKTVLQNMTGMGDSGDDDTDLGLIINRAAKEVYLAFEWTERWKEATVETVEPYSTGTATVTEGDATVEFAGGTVLPSTPSIVNARKFALGYGQPPYLVLSRTDDDTLELARNYAGATASAQSYVLYSDVYDIGTDVHRIPDHGVRLHHGTPNGALPYLPRRRLDRSDYLPTSTGRPRSWTEVPDQTAGTRRIQIQPIPDDDYTLSIIYLRGFTTMTTLLTTGLDDSREDLVLNKALYWAYKMTNRMGDARQALEEFRLEMADAKAQARLVHPTPVAFTGYDDGPPAGEWATLLLPEST